MTAKIIHLGYVLALSLVYVTPVVLQGRMVCAPPQHRESAMVVDKTMWAESERIHAFGLAVMAALLIGLLLVAEPARAATFTVNVAADPGTDGCDATECTLREAITAANANANEPTVDLINFAIPGAGPHKISPASDLPPITEAVTIDGYTQGDSTPADSSDDATENTLAVGNNAVLKIELDGENVFNGLMIQAANSTVKGLIINRFDDNVSVWINGSGATGNKVEGNYIGTDATGTQALGNQTGVRIDGSNNIVGGTDAGARNIISGNNIGVSIFDSGATGNQIMGNYIGTDKDGDDDLGNNLGVNINGASNNMVGGTDAGARNIISGNIPSPPEFGLDGDGVVITSPGTTNNKVEGNYIGTDASGTADLGNSGSGVRIDNQASSNTVGGTDADDGTVDGVVKARNIISGNSADGVVIRGSSSTGNPILSNSVHENGELGIDLVGGDETAFGVTRNDNKDPDKGANRRQNFPVVSSATLSGGQITLSGRLNSRPRKTFTIQFFSSPAADPSGFGEGTTFLGQIRVKTNREGKRSFSRTLVPLQTVSPVEKITATATRLVPDPSDPTTLLPTDTSEFSVAREVT